MSPALRIGRPPVGHPEAAGPAGGRSAQDDQFRDFEVKDDFPNIGRRTMLLNARRLLRRDGRAELILLAIEDITMRRHLEIRSLQRRFGSES